MNNNEPIVLGKVKKGKTGKPLIVLIIFLFIGAFLFVIPAINEYFAEYNIVDLLKDGNLIDFIQNREKYISKNNNNTSTTTTKITEEKTNYINKKTVLEYNNFNINNFILTESNITYTINTTTNINFNKSNYYLIIYKDIEKITIKLTGEVNGSKEYTFTFINNLSSSVDVKGKIEEINQSEYPNITLSKNEFGISILKCTKESEIYEYTFNNNNLTNIKETIKYTNSNVEIDNTNLQKYQSISNNLILLGANSEIILTATGFTLINEIDLNLYNYSKNTNYNYYSLNTQPKIINYEMKAKGYDCK